MSATPSLSNQIACGVPAEARGYPRAVWVFGILFLLTGGWLAYTLATNPDQIPWPFVVVNFIFFLGITQFGVCFAAIMRICGAQFSKPYHRLGEIMTLAFAPFTILLFLIIFYFGRHELYYWIDDGGEHSPFLNEGFLFWRNLVAQLVFYGLAKYYFFIDLAPDLNSEDARQGSWYRRTIYRLVPMFLPKDAANPENARRRLYLLSTPILMVAVISQTIIAWDFGMMLVHHYHSTVYPLIYMVGNMLAGCAAIYLMFLWMSRYIPVSPWFKVIQLKNMGITLTAFSLLWLYMFWAQFFVSWFGNLSHEYGVVSLAMYGHYGKYFWVMMICVFGIPIGSMIFAAVKRHRWSLAVVAFFMIVGMWLNRYLMVIPGLMDGDRPFSSGNELLVTLAILSGYLFLLLWLFRHFPMLSRWQIDSMPKADDHH